MSRAASQEDQSDPLLYRKMKMSQGGVMLLVRLYADLSEQPLAFLRRIREVPPMPALPAGSRLAATFSWLERQFGRSNAVRALAETANDVLRAVPAQSGPGDN